MSDRQAVSRDDTAVRATWRALHAQLDAPPPVLEDHVGLKLSEISNVHPMNTYISLFRGINVGGRNTLPMKDLVAMLEELGATHVRTYLQSGNAVFQSVENDLSQLHRRLAAEIKRRQGFEPHILLLEPDTISQAITHNPFPGAEADSSNLHLGFLASAPKNPNIEKLSSLKKASERFYLGNDVFYLHAPEGVGRSKLAANAEKWLGVTMTDRNWRTVCKINELSLNR